MARLLIAAFAVRSAAAFVCRGVEKTKTGFTDTPPTKVFVEVRRSRNVFEFVVAAETDVWLWLQVAVAQVAQVSEWSPASTYLLPRPATHCDSCPAITIPQRVVVPTT